MRHRVAMSYISYDTRARANCNRESDREIFAFPLTSRAHARIATRRPHYKILRLYLTSRAHARIATRVNTATVHSTALTSRAHARIATAKHA